MCLAALKNYNVIMSAIVFVVLFNSCKSSGTGPEDNVPAGRRDYVWTVDTLNKMAPFNRYAYLYGTSPKSIWCIGQGDFSTSFLHHDSTGWKFVNYSSTTGGLDPCSVFGFSNDIFWIGGRESRIWKCENGRIFELGRYPYDGYGQTVIKSVCGRSPNDLYAGGCVYSVKNDKLFHFMMHYDGKKWNYLYKPEIEGQFLEMKMESNQSNNIFIKNYIAETANGDSVAIYLYDGIKLHKLYYDIYSSRNAPGMMKAGEKILFGFKEKIYTYKEGRFNPIVDLSNTNLKTLAKLCGRSEKDFFFNLNDGIGHYNGVNVENIYKVNELTSISNSLILENDVYFLLFDVLNNQNLLLHGRLK